MVAAVESKPELDKYELKEEIGHGGMATVYRALDRRLGRDVAIKIIHRHLRENTEVKLRFVSEARAVAKLRHPNIVEVYDVSDPGDEERYLVVEFVRGTTLRKLLSTYDHLPAEIAAAIGVEIANALDHAHSMGVIHRDIKPENVLVATAPAIAPEPGEAEVPLIKITDFGIAKLLDAQGVTSTGQVLGSPAHMAPEQIEGGEVSARSDVFGTGVMLYETMVGKLPFDGKNPAQVLRRVLEGSFAPAEKARPTIGAPFGAILNKALAHAPEDRYATAGELAAALRAELEALGFTEYRKELRTYLTDPEAYVQAYEKRVVTELIAHAEKARAERAVSRSAALLNRALAFRPDDTALLQEVANLGRRERLKKNLRSAGIAVLGSVALAAAGFAATRVAERFRSIPRLAPSSVVLRPERPELARSTSVPRPLESGDIKAEPRRRPTMPHAAPIKSDAVAKVRIVNVEPPDSIVRIDGIEVVNYLGDRTLAVGTHVFEFEPRSPECCRGLDRQEINVKPPANPEDPVIVTAHIPLRPAILWFKSPEGGTASCGALFKKYAIPSKNEVPMGNAVWRIKCTIFSPPGAAQESKLFDVTLRAGGTSPYPG